jgi:hypothetical protein
MHELYSTQRAAIRWLAAYIDTKWLFCVEHGWFITACRMSMLMCCSSTSLCVYFISRSSIVFMMTMSMSACQWNVRVLQQYVSRIVLKTTANFHLAIRDTQLPLKSKVIDWPMKNFVKLMVSRLQYELYKQSDLKWLRGWWVYNTHLSALQKWSYNEIIVLLVSPSPCCLIDMSAMWQAHYDSTYDTFHSTKYLWGS